MEGTATSSAATTPRKSDDKLGGLFSCCGRLTRKFLWLKVRRSGVKHDRSLTSGANFDCKSLASVAVAPKQPRPVGDFQYDPLSYSQNFDDGCWYDNDEGGIAGRGFSSRFASLPSRPPPINATTTGTAATHAGWD
ncbi:hypothetical protein MLD38_024682 [Melastoma candidum]|uniref:Uncharacterized protein n=1 Tax=Melastoma candidum TaxID=119954 RepID=A0ACB9NT50_9MYRT|nr:hypothetical protein MLD38_024682 [Melastoma candidum]